MTRVTIGHWPEMGLAEARRQAARTRDQIEQGADRIAAARAKRETLEEQSRVTFDVARRQFLDHYAFTQRRPAPKTIAETSRLLLAKDLDALASRPLAALNRRDIRDAVESIVARGAPVVGNRTLSAIGIMLAWCVDRELIESDPSIGIRKPAVEHSRSRVLSRSEMGLVWKATDDGHPYSEIVRMLALTGQRRGEIAASRFDDVVDVSGIRCLSIPPEHSKNRRPHLVPLAPEALAIIQRRSRFMTYSGYIFENTKGGPFSAWTGKTSLDKRLNIPAWTLHDLRRTMVTIMNESLKIPPHIVESVVNHVSGRPRVANIYNRAVYLEERRAALDAYAAWILDAAKG